MTDAAQTQPIPEIRFITIFGMPCAGKDTAGFFIRSVVPDSEVLSTGNEIRDAKKFHDHPLHDALEAHQQTASKGQLLPTEAIVNLENPGESVFPFIMERALSAGATTLISTGFPRNLEQTQVMARYFEERFPDTRMHIDYVFLDVDPKLLEGRMLDRTEERKARGEEPRDDDNVETLPERLRTYEAHTLPIVAAYGENVIRINANGPKKEVNQAVLEALDARHPLGIPRPQVEGAIRPIHPHHPGGERG